MSTRGEFAFTDSNGDIFSIYVHCDAYPSGLGEEMLRNIHNTQEAFDYTLQYLHETSDSVYKFDTLLAYKQHVVELDREFLYLFVNDKWYVYVGLSSFLPDKWKNIEDEYDIPFFRLELKKGEAHINFDETYD